MIYIYCIMNIQKRKTSDIRGIQQEANRTAVNYNNRVDIGMEVFNVKLIYNENWLGTIQQEIKAAGAHTRSNSIVALDTIYTASPQFFKDRNNEENDQFFKDCLKFHKSQFGHVISAIIHYDETTPHMHVISIPITKDGRLSARDVIGNRANMIHLQDEFFRNVGQEYGLERGIHIDGPEKKQHISAQEYELQQIKQEKETQLNELKIIKHSKQYAQERTERAIERAKEQKAQNEALKVSESQLRAQMEREQRMARQLNEMNEQARRKLKATHDKLQELKPYLQEAEQRQIRELILTRQQEDEWDEWKR